MGFNPISWIGDAISGVASGVSSIINSLNAPDSEKNKIRQVLNSQLNNLKIVLVKSQTDYEKELTKRLEADMQSDSWLAKNIRPLTLVYIFLLLTILIVIDAYGIKVDSEFKTILKIWGGLGLGFYFGGRWNEKINRIKNLKSGINKIAKQL